MRHILLTAKAIPLCLAPLAGAADHDLVIKNGRGIDPETGYDAVANV